MENLLEYLVPLIVVAFWIFGKVMEGRARSGEDSGENEHYDEEGSWDSWEQNEEAERTRRIQEEIRRKIAERRGEVEPDTPPPPLPGRPVTAGRQAFPPPTTYHTEPQVIRVEPPRRNYAAELEAREKELAETLKKAEEIRAGAQRSFPQARPAHTVHEVHNITRTGRAARKADHQNLRHALHQEVIDSLQNPTAARKAFLFHEILGSPVALRTDGHPKLIADA